VDAREFCFLPENPADPGAPVSAPVTWFRNPIHDMESAWWIVFWAFCYLEHWVPDSLFTNHDLRLLTLLHPSTLHNKCIELPVALQKPLIQWPVFMREKYMELGKQILAGTHHSFNYDEVFVRVIGYIEEIIVALSKIKDPTLDTEDRASKRRKGNE
jgi:hypothetical protein